MLQTATETTTALPEGFRISEIQVSGSGRGDEIFALALFRWGPVFGRRGLLRRRAQTGMAWKHCETGDWFAGSEQAQKDLVQTARLLSQKNAPHA